MGTWVGTFPLIDAAAVADFWQLQILLFLLLVPNVIRYKVVAAMELVTRVLIVKPTLTLNVIVIIILLVGMINHYHRQNIY